MKVLITGADGQVGRDFLYYAQDKCQVLAYNHQILDITQAQNINNLFTEQQPDVVINAAAYTMVDRAEQEQQQAQLVNAEGAKLLAIACNKLAIPLIHLSTDYVFSGEKNTPYIETDTTTPLNIYGQTKLAGEQAIRAICPKHIILRVSGVFSAHKTNFVKTMLGLGKTRSSLQVVNNQFLCPTASIDIASALYILCKSTQADFTPWGTYHYCSDTVTSWFDFASAIFAYARQHTELKLHDLQPIPSSAYPTPAKRPTFSALNCEKIYQQLNIIQPFWQKSLPRVISELLSELPA